MCSNVTRLNLTHPAGTIVYQCVSYVIRDSHIFTQMTRINVVPPNELCNKHLIAEYRELPRVFRLAREDANIPAEYTLGKGHVTFFYNKLAYLISRQTLIIEECKHRGFDVKFNASSLKEMNKNERLYGDYEPTEEALKINRKRIADRMNSFRSSL